MIHRKGREHVPERVSLFENVPGNALEPDLCCIRDIQEPCFCPGMLMADLLQSLAGICSFPLLELPPKRGPSLIPATSGGMVTSGKDDVVPELHCIRPVLVGIGEGTGIKSEERSVEVGFLGISDSIPGEPFCEY